MDMEVGQRIRLISDASRIGVYTGEFRERDSIKRYKISFPSGIQYIPEDQIEILGDENEHPLDLFEKGKHTGAKELRRVLTHIRLGGKLIDLIYSMEISNTDFYAYQYKPIIKLLNSPNNGILIADEVGLGKTIEAALIWTELKSRYDLRKLCVLCPAVLREKWQEELKRRFGINAHILDGRQLTSRLKSIRNTDPLDSYALITSMQGSRISKELKNFLEENENEIPLIDTLIIDEAHYLRNRETKTSQIARAFRKVSEFIILLSATPIHLRNEDLFQLVNLIDPNTFDRIDAFINIISANAPLLKARDYILHKNADKQRIIDLLNSAKQNEILKQSKQLTGLISLIENYNEFESPIIRAEIAAKLESVNLLGNVLTRTRKREVTEWKVIRDPIDIPIEMTSYESEFYYAVTNTVRDYCNQYKLHEGFLLTTPQRQMASSMPAALYSWRKRSGLIDDELNEIYGCDPEIEENSELIAQLLQRLENFGNENELYNNDSKFRLLLNIVKSFFEENPTDKIIIFSYFRATLFYLKKRLERESIGCSLLIGGQKRSKSDIIDEFKNSKKERIMLSSEVGSEGVDLQFCHGLVNYDLPWNPMRIEQRIGRIDRLGQEAEKVKIWNLFYDKTIDSRIYIRLFQRLNIFRYALGDLEAILGEKIRELAFDLLNKKLTADEEQDRIDQTAFAIENKKRHEEELEIDAAHLVAHGDYIINQVKAARELNRWIHSDDIKHYIIDFFQAYYPGCDFKRIDDQKNIFDISLSNQAKNDLESFIREERISIPTLLIRSAAKPFTYMFENKLVFDSRSRIEVINQIHPLVRFVNKQYPQKTDLQQFPAVSVRLDSKTVGYEIASGLYAFSVQKWSIKGLQQIEKIDFTAILLQDDVVKTIDKIMAERMILSVCQHGQKWTDAQSTINLAHLTSIIEKECLAKSDASFSEFRTLIENQNYDRAMIQITNLEKHRKSEINKWMAIREIHLQNKRIAHAKAAETRINNINNRIDRKISEFEKAKIVTGHKEDIGLGVIMVY